MGLVLAFSWAICPRPRLPADARPFSSHRTHANGSIKRGSKDNATDSVPLRTGIGVQLKDIKVFNRDRQKGEARALGRAGEARGPPWEPRVRGQGEKLDPGAPSWVPEAQGWQGGAEELSAGAWRVV